MTISIPETQQDTVKAGRFLINESIRLNTFSLPAIRQVSLKDTGKHFTPPARIDIKPSVVDTTAVCTRNSIADVTYYDTNNVILHIESGSYNQFPFSFTNNIRQKKIEERTLLIKQLKPGKVLPAHPLHTDWMIIIIIVSAFLYSLIKTTSRSISPDFAKFFLFRGINDPSSRDIGGLFHWQSTILNLSSFLIIGLFGYSAISYFNLIPVGFKGILIWLLALAIISVAVALRHIVCIVTGAVSGEHEVFRQYLLGIYQTYRFAALFLFVLIILMAYTIILPVGTYIITGIIITGMMYLIRVIRLFVIFLNRNISIFYLILYLCALEILPVLIVVKYFTGLV
jgi:hypothetical protein